MVGDTTVLMHPVLHLIILVVEVVPVVMHRVVVQVSVQVV